MIKAAVLGSPIAHSLSPSLHRAAYAKLGIEAEYGSFEVKENELANFIENHAEWTGFSLTMPLKEVALEIATSIDPIAKQIRSGNTLLRRGRDWFLTSTDRTGFISLLASHKLLNAERVLILGAGGTARAALSALDRDGRVIDVLRRRSSQDAALMASAPASQLHVINAATHDGSRTGIAAGSYNLVINTIPADQSAHYFVDYQSAPPLIDVLYHPWPTQLAALWHQHNDHVVSGIELLIWQGIDQIELMSGAQFDRDEMFAYLFHTLVRPV